MMSATVADITEALVIAVENVGNRLREGCLAEVKNQERGGSEKEEERLREEVESY